MPFEQPVSSALCGSNKAATQCPRTMTPLYCLQVRLQRPVMLFKQIHLSCIWTKSALLLIGGLTPSGNCPPWVERRLNLAAHIQRQQGLSSRSLFIDCKQCCWNQS